MNTLLVYSIYDSKAQAFLQPFFAMNRAVALRMFMNACQDVNSDFHRFAGDYTLFEIGEWNQYEGKLVSFEAKDSLGLASQYLNGEGR